MQIRDELNVAMRGEERKNVRRREYVVEAQSGDNGKGPLKRLYLKELHRQPNPPSSHCLANEESIQQSPACECLFELISSLSLILICYLELHIHIYIHSNYFSPAS